MGSRNRILSAREPDLSTLRFPKAGVSLYFPRNPLPCRRSLVQNVNKPIISAMKRNILLGAVLLCATSLVAADAGSDVKAAAKKLSEKGNYSWKSTSESAGGGGGNRGGGPTEGKTDAGTVYLSMTRGDNTLEAVLKGEKGAIKGQEGWQSIAEATEGEGGAGRGRFMARMLQNFKAPAAQAEELAGKATGLKKDGDAYAGELPAEAVKGLMSFGRRGGGDGPEISGAKGNVKFWVKDGALSKYQYNVQGTMTFNGNDREINRTTTVEIKDVGTTKLTVPDEAKKKLS